MPTLRALKTLNEVESGTLDGANLEIKLTEAGYLAGFYSLLSTRGQTRRIASNALTMVAVGVSERAQNAILETATLYNQSAAAGIASSSAAMNLITLSLPSLTTAIENPIAWDLVTQSDYFETNIKSVVSLFANITNTSLTTITEIITDPASTYSIAQSRGAMESIVNAPTAMGTFVNTTTAMDDVVARTEAFTILANNDVSINLVAQSTVAMATLTDAAIGIVIHIPSALKIFASYETLWADLVANLSTLSDNIYDMMVSFSGVDSTQFETVSDIFANDVAMNQIASNRASMVAILNEPTTLGLFCNSTQITIALTNPISMGLLSTNVSALNILIGNTISFTPILANASAKATIFSTPSLITTMTTAGSTSLATLTALSVDFTGPTPDTVIGTFQSLGLAGKIIILTAKIGSITAATVDNSFYGTTQAVSTFACPGTHAASVYPIINLPFTDTFWDINSIAATAAAKVTVTYVDFN